LCLFLPANRNHQDSSVVAFTVCEIHRRVRAQPQLNSYREDEVDYLQPLAGANHKSSQEACNLRPHGASDSHSKQTGDHETISPTASLFVPPAAVDFAILDSSAHYLEILSDVADHAGASN
jgi:hypothetical protein